MFYHANKYANLSANVYYRQLSIPKEYTFCILTFIFFSAFRWDVGADHLSYLLVYNEIMDGTFTGRLGFEEGFLFITKIFAEYKIHYTLFFGFCAFWQIFFITKAFEKERSVLAYIYLLIPLAGYFIVWSNGIRQMIVACSFVWAIKFILNRQLIYYLLWVIVCFFIHRSVLILLPLYFLPYLCFNVLKRKYALLILLGCIIIGSIPYWINSLSKISNMLDLLGYDKYVQRIEIITDEEMIREVAWGPRRILTLMTYAINIWFFKDVKQYFNNKKVELIYQLAFLGICYYYIFANTGYLFLRPNAHFLIFILPLTAYTLVYLRKMRNNFNYYCLLICSCSFTWFACWSDYEKIGLSRTVNLYKFCFEHWDGFVNILNL